MLPYRVGGQAIRSSVSTGADVIAPEMGDSGEAWEARRIDLLEDKAITYWQCKAKLQAEKVTSGLGEAWSRDDADNLEFLWSQMRAVPTIRFTIDGSECIGSIIEYRESPDGMTHKIQYHAGKTGEEWICLENKMPINKEKEQDHFHLHRTMPMPMTLGNSNGQTGIPYAEAYRAEKACLKPTATIPHLVEVGISWDVNPDPSKTIDLDLACIVVTYDGIVKCAVYHKLLKGVSKYACITHSGDEKSGAKDGTDERVQVNLSELPSDVRMLLFVVSSHSGGAICDALNGKVHVKEEKQDPVFVGPLGRAAPMVGSMLGTASLCMMMERVERGSNEWKLYTLDGPVVNTPRSTFMDLADQNIVPLIRRIIPGAKTSRLLFDIKKPVEIPEGVYQVALGWRSGAADTGAQEERRECAELQGKFLTRSQMEAGYYNCGFTDLSPSILNEKWEGAEVFKAANIDLDLSAVLFTKESIESANPFKAGAVAVNFQDEGDMNKIGVRHRGDVTKAGNEEVIAVTLDNINSEVEHIVFCVNANKGVTFGEVAHCSFASVLVVRIELSLFTSTSMMVASVMTV